MFPFIHIPRTAGTSVILALKNAIGYITTYPEDLHWSVQKRINNSLWTNSNSFTIIRSPWDRLVSWYFWHQPNKLTFHDWILTGMPTNDHSAWFDKNLNPLDQEAFFTIDGKVMVDFIGRFENLSECVNTLEKIFNTKMVIQYIHKSYHLDYHTYYTPETKEIVATRFKDFINKFGYEF